jgi:hypothetical protein
LIRSGDVVRRRLAGQFLTAPRPPNASDVVSALGAVQAQDYAGAKWALAQRTQGATDAGIERELSDGSILRTHVLRPTWHFVTPRDIRWMLALTAPRVRAAMAYHDRVLELDARVVRRSNKALTQALTRGRHRTRAELGEGLERAGVRNTPGQRLAPLRPRAALDAGDRSGPRRGKQFTYALLEERVPPAARLERDEALLELTRRFFSTRGPATERDFAWWSGLTMSDARRGIQVAGRTLEPLRSTKGTSGSRRAPSDGVALRASAVQLRRVLHRLQGSQRDCAPTRHREPVTGGTALNAHVVCVDGQLVGGWMRILSKQAVVVELELVARLTTTERALVAAAARTFGAFLEMPVTLRG